MKHQYRITVFYSSKKIKSSEPIDILAWNTSIALRQALEFVGLNPLLDEGCICTIKIERLD
jgi:hypothetical protein